MSALELAVFERDVTDGLCNTLWRRQQRSHDGYMILSDKLTWKVMEFQSVKV